MCLGQCCSLKIHLPTDEKEKEVVIQRINTILPSDIRLITATKVTKCFNSHTACSNRRYCYLLPTYLFTNITTMNNLLHTALTKQGLITDCARAGGFVEPGSKKYCGATALVEIREKSQGYRVSIETLDLFKKALHFYEGTKSYHNFTTGKESGEDSSKRYITSCTCSQPFYTNQHVISHSTTPLPSSTSSSSSAVTHSDVTHQSGVTGPEPEIGGESIRSALGQGGPQDSEEQVMGTGTEGECEWVCVTIEGQSFVLNQIRKMIGLAVDVS